MEAHVNKINTICIDLAQRGNRFVDTCILGKDNVWILDSEGNKSCILLF